MASVKLRARRPAPASSTIVSATCATMSTSRARICRRLLVPPRVLSDERVGDPDAAGAPGGEQAEDEGDTSRRRRREGHRRPAHRHLVEPRRVGRSHARRTPAPQPPRGRRRPPRRAPAMVIVSASHWRVIRPTEAPSASWTANSRCRDAARATSRFETLVHATRSSRSEAASSSRSAGRTPAVSTSRMGTATASAIIVSLP